MIEPKIDDLLARVDSKYTLPMVDAGPNRKALSVALQELVEDKLNWERPAEVAESIK
jgi:DNA-directed RNA polymerase subunit K/omega